MSAEQRVTDEVGDVIDQCVLKLANTQMNMSLEEWGEISNALLGVGIAHRATEAKLAAALAEVADFKQQLDQRNAKLAEAESDLAATKAKLEVLEAVACIAWRLCIHVDLVPYTNSMGVTLSSSVGVYEELKERLAALTTKEATDAK